MIRPMFNNFLFNSFVLKLPADCLAVCHELKGKYLPTLTTIHEMSD